MNWLIVEDALRNRTGHWNEYISTFSMGLEDLGYSRTILVDRQAESFIVEQEAVNPILPESIWHRMGQGGRLARYARVPSHAWSTYNAVHHWLKKNPDPDLIFVPTVLVHHLLGWWRLYQRVLQKRQTRLLLFFPNTPIQWNVATQQPCFGTDPTSRLFVWLIRKLKTAVADRRVILGTETYAMRDALTQSTGVEFTYLPHPVAGVSGPADQTESPSPLRMGCYGAARHEKGSDLFQSAVVRDLESHPKADCEFVMQWLEDFSDDSGKIISKDPKLVSHPRVKFIDQYFQGNQYEEQLRKTHVMVLPYREPYRFRVSRVVIEAMLKGMPVIATRGTTLWEQANQFGSAVACELNDIQSLSESIETVRSNYPELKRQALQRVPLVQQHFSVAHFVECLQQHLQSSSNGSCAK